MSQLRGQVAIISGGLGDIGKATALELASRGADVGISDILDEKKATAVLDAIRSKGVRAHYAKVDISDAAATKKWIDAVEGELGLPTLIVPNAAIVEVLDVRSVDPESWTRHMRVNLDGAFFMAQIAANKLSAAKKPGRIAYIGSWAGHAVHLKIPAYCASKAALRIAMRTLALEFAPENILVNEVAPGWVDAGLSGRLFDENPGTREKAAARVPVKRLITAHDVALQVAWLCDPTNVHTTGSVLLMDGGLSLVTPAYG
jgi:glucose 1-dehydrogenase